MRTSLAFLDHGAWKADCPEPGCGDARLVYEINPRTGVPTGRRLTEDVCAKGHRFAIEMPPPEFEAQVVAAVADRALDADKSWFPKGHQRAALAGIPVGQSIDDLVRENADVERFRTAEQDARRRRAADILAELGVEVRPDGTFEGSL